MKNGIGFFVFLIVMICVPLNSQDGVEDKNFKPLFIRATIYPTYSLSRYDYNNDINKIELRVYIKLSQGNLDGDNVEDARVSINNQVIKFDPDMNDYRERIEINKEKLTRELNLKIKTKDGLLIKKKYNYPGWIIIKEPQPWIYDREKGIDIKFEYTEYKFPFTVHVYDFKKGTRLMVEKKEHDDLITIDPKDLSSGTIVRIWIVSDWFFKKYLTGKDIARGSEINIIPWSQSFIRIK